MYVLFFLITSAPQFFEKKMYDLEALPQKSCDRSATLLKERLRQICFL